jgi:hypothetical protein
MFYFYKRGGSLGKPPQFSQALPKYNSKTIKISKIFLTAIGLAIGVTIAACVTLILIFRPYRYTGKAYEIREELAPPQDRTSSQAEEIPMTDRQREILNKLSQDPEYMAEVAKRQQMLGIGSLAPAASTPAYIDKQAIEARTGKPAVFGGTEEFFQYCGDADAVFWNPVDIGGSIQSRQEYLLAKLKTILLSVFSASLIISYLILYSRKKRIRILIN